MHDEYVIASSLRGLQLPAIVGGDLHGARSFSEIILCCGSPNNCEAAAMDLDRDVPQRYSQLRG